MKATFNPFLVKGYLGSDYFCDRIQETKQIVSAIKNSRNLNLYNIRRIGKTALIRHALNQLPNTYVPIFIDIEKTENQGDLIKILIDALAKKIDQLDKNLFRKVIQWASSLGATIGVDEITGLPKVDVYVNNNRGGQNLEEVFTLTQLISKKKFVIAIDEFQQILSYPETNTEAIFRSITQEFPSIAFIFSGSSRHLMEKMFTDSSAPFYQSTENVQLDYIAESEYLLFAKKFLPTIDDEFLTHLMEWCRYHTYYVQYTLNVLYESVQLKETLHIAELKERILKSHEFYYFSIRKLVTKDQWTILKHIAQNSPVLKPLSASFSGKTGIAQSTLKYNLNQLETKDLILREEDGFKIYNVFFGHLLGITKP